MSAGHLIAGLEAGVAASEIRPIPTDARPEVRGKFLYVNGAKFLVRGVTYGPFRPSDEHGDYPPPATVERDFAQMADHGINAVRMYTMPPRWILDCAHRHGLKAMVGLAWEQHIAFLTIRGQAAGIEKRVAEAVRSCAGHPAILCYSVGNEIPANIVRWYGRERVEKFIERLYRAAKREDPGALVTYVNYPTTEYLQLPFLDLVCFNVYLEQKRKFESYLARLQNIAGNRPLMMAEVGLDSLRNGEMNQAKLLDWQVRSSFALGSAGVFVFSWTDQWHRGGEDVTDWAFGLTNQDRRPKPALEIVRHAFAAAPMPADLPWPRISVVICTYNGSRTLRQCLEGVSQLDYPDYEVIVINDGSTDATESIAKEHDVRLITTPNRGLSAARNEGMRAATGEIVAYIDDDAWPDPHWLTYLAMTFMSTNHVAVGGPNIGPPDDGPIAYCVAHAPGGPQHVLLTDREAEHLPGCNLAIRKASLESISGFDSQFRIAGDDVDVCWRLQATEGTLGFSPGALVWHRRRNSVKAFWKQQFQYGKAEAMLEIKWPEKYNSMGHLTWHGRLYHNSTKSRLPFRKWRVYHGVWGTGLFQSIYGPGESQAGTILQMPECYLLVIGLAVFTGLGAVWTPMLWAAPVLGLLMLALLIQAMTAAAHVPLAGVMGGTASRLKWRVLLTCLYLMQPLARLGGRLRYGLTPWRKRAGSGLALPRPQTVSIWSEQWKSLEDRLHGVEAALRNKHVVVLRGDVFARWDLEVPGGILGAVRMRTMIEDHAKGHQMVRFTIWPVFSPAGFVAMVGLGVLAGLASMEGALIAALLLGVPAILAGLRMLLEAARATGAVRLALRTSQTRAANKPGSAAPDANVTIEQPAPVLAKESR